MASIVYIMCAVTSGICAVLLTRAYMRTHARLLLWSSLCFSVFMVANILLFVDRTLLASGPDLSRIRNTISLLGVSIMLFGLIWEGRT